MKWDLNCSAGKWRKEFYYESTGKYNETRLFVCGNLKQQQEGIDYPYSSHQNTSAGQRSLRT